MFLKKRKKSEKTTWEKEVAMVSTNFMDKNMLCQIVSRLILGIGQFQLRPSPPRAIAGHLRTLSVKFVDVFSILCINFFIAYQDTA